MLAASCTIQTHMVTRHRHINTQCRFFNGILLVSLSLLQRNKAGQQIMVSHYLPMNTQTRDDKLPVVVYCHCNSGSRRDAEEAVWHLLPCGVGVVAFDFTVSTCAWF
jgi:predicted dienelactone hydrolase